MPSPASPIARPSVGRTFTVAVSVLGLIALAQLTAIGWVFVHRFQTLTERAKAGPGLRFASNNIGKMPGDLASTETTEKLETNDPFGESTSAGVTSSDPILPPSKPVPLSMAKLNPPPPPPETRLEELVQQGRQLRDRGDTAAALVKFREAQTLDPSNPSPIADIAVTYERMSLMDKAGEQWRRIYEMGESAGPFYVAAESRLKLAQTQANAAVQIQQQREFANEGPVSKTRSDATLGIGDINQVDRSHEGTAHFLLRVPIKAKRTEKVSVADVDIQVFFYDQVGGKNVVQTDADLNYKFTSQPIDWSGNDPEVLEVDYSRQASSGRSRNEQRQFYGYVVRLYHKGELQDVRYQPEDLSKQFPAPTKLDSATPNK